MTKACMVSTTGNELIIRAYGRMFTFKKAAVHQYDIYEHEELILHFRKMDHYVMVVNSAGRTIIAVNGEQVAKRSDEECCELAADLIARWKDK